MAVRIPTIVPRARRAVGLAALSTLLLTGVADAAPVVTGASPMLKPFPRLSEQPDAQPIQLRVARNEFASFQVLIQGTEGAVRGVRAAPPVLEGPGGSIGGDSVTLYRVGYVNVSTPSFPNGRTGLHPDPLIPHVDETVGEARGAFPFDVPANETRSIWVDVHVPDDTQPGTYEGSVRVTGEGLEADVPVSLEVLGATLPSTSSLDSAFLLFSGNACTALTGKYDCGGYAKQDEVLGDFQRLALDHRITLPNVFLRPQGGENWSAWDASYAPFIEGRVDTRLEGARVTSVQYVGQRDMNRIAAWTDHMEAKGWLDVAYDYTGDEPPYGISFDEARSRLAAVKEAAPKLRTLLTTTLQASEQYGLTDTIDVLSPVINHMDGAEGAYAGDQRPLYEDFLASGSAKRLWVYQSCMSHGCGFGTNLPNDEPDLGWPSYMVDASSAKNRAMQWLNYLEDVSGELYYETAMVLPGAWDSTFAFSGNGDGTLFYPGTPNRIGGATPVPLPSLRLKLIRLGMQDYEWLKLVAESGDDGYGRSTARALLPAAYRVPDEGSLFEQAREALVSRWLELNPSSSTGGGPGDGPGDGSGSGTDSGNGSGSGDGALLPEDLSFEGGGGGCSSTSSDTSLPLGLTLAALLGAGVVRRRRRSA